MKVYICKYVEYAGVEAELDDRFTDPWDFAEYMLNTRPVPFMHKVAAMNWIKTTAHEDFEELWTDLTPEEPILLEKVSLTARTGAKKSDYTVYDVRHGRDLIGWGIIYHLDVNTWKE